MNPLRNFSENHPLGTIIAAFATGAGLATWVLTLVYVPSQLTSAERALLECKQSAGFSTLPQPRDGKKIELSMEEFAIQYDSLRSNFAEQRAFLRRCKGLRVKWRISNGFKIEWPRRNQYSLTFINAMGPVHTVVFDPKFKKLLSDLPPVSLIEVTGTLDLPDPEATELELIAEEVVVVEPYVTGIHRLSTAESAGTS
jgi:hypothetical protein